jgi:hypothetical protein
MGRRRPEQKRYPVIQTQRRAYPYAPVMSVPAPGLVARALYVPTPCAQCGWRSYVRATNTTDRCAKCGRERV